MPANLSSKRDSFESQRLLYRGIERKDADKIVEWRSDASVYKYSLNPTAITLEAHLAWFDACYLSDNARYDFIAELKEKPVPIGVVGVSQVDLESNSAYLNYLIGEKQYQKMGFASEAVSEVMRFFNSQLGLKTYFATVNKENVNSLKLLKKLEFSIDKIEGDFYDFKKQV